MEQNDILFTYNFSRDVHRQLNDFYVIDNNEFVQLPRRLLLMTLQSLRTTMTVFEDMIDQENDQEIQIHPPSTPPR